MAKKRLGKKKRRPRALWAIDAVRLEKLLSLFPTPAPR